jgi:hypothetical protein
MQVGIEASDWCLVQSSSDVTVAFNASNRTESRLGLSPLLQSTDSLNVRGRISWTPPESRSKIAQDRSVPPKKRPALPETWAGLDNRDKSTY